MQDSKYPAIYDKIDHIKGEIRLLKLLPSTDNEAPICCDLFRHNLDSDNNYTSLSYCWGPLDPAQLITLQGQDFSITPNLHAALKRLRQTDTTKIMWVDALCIDQSNTAEKGHQVGQMGAIYSNAECTVMWLGTETKDCDLALKLTEHFGWMGVSPTTETIKAWSDSLLDTFTSDAYDSHWAAMSSLLNVGYWRRAWIIQEVVLSKNLVLMCGSITIVWGNLTIISKLMELTAGLESTGMDYRKNPFTSKSLMSTVKELESMRRARQDKKVLTLVQGLFTSGLRCATDHRDHVYSALGIVQDSYGVVSNYKLCAECVYVDAIERIITKDKSLDILSLCKGFSAKRRDEIKRYHTKLGCYVNWVRNGACPASNPLIRWRAGGEDEDKEDDEFRFTGSPESVGCLCRIQSGEMPERFTAGLLGLDLGLDLEVFMGFRSWVPNWPHRFNDAGMIFQEGQYKLLYQGEQCHFRASGTSEASFQFSMNKEHLTVSGFIFDQVSYVTGMQGSKKIIDRFMENTQHSFTFPEIWLELERRQPGPNFYGDDIVSLHLALLRSLASGRGVNGGKLTNEDIRTLVWGKQVSDESQNDRSKHPNIDKSLLSRSYFAQLITRNWFNEMIITSKGAVGAIEKEVREGDLVCILLGARIPFILRPDKDKYFLIGETCRFLP